MSDIEDAKALLHDAFSRVRDGVAGLADGLTDQAATYRPDSEANTVAWLLWHLSRVQDDHIADAAGTGQVWPRWRDRFDLPFEPDATGYGQTSDEVARVRVPGELLAGYHADVDAATRTYLDSLTGAELERVVDDSWDPPVTVAVRLVSVIDDCVQHLGQAEYVRGLAERAAG